MAGQSVAVSQVQHDGGGEGLAGSGAVTGRVEDLGGLGVGVVVEEPVEFGERVSVGLAGLPSGERDWDGQAGGVSAFEAARAGVSGRSCGW